MHNSFSSEARIDNLLVGVIFFKVLDNKLNSQELMQR